MTKRNRKAMTNPANWVSSRARAKAGKIVVNWIESTIPGIWIAEAHLKGEKTMAVGWVWFRHETGNVISLNMSFVLPQLRRCGIRTAIHKQILEWYPETRLVVTARANETSYDWLEKTGFVFSEEMDRWELHVPKPESVSKPQN